MKTFVLDLDTPPKARWAAVASAYRSRFAALVERNAKLIRALSMVEAFVPGKLLRTCLPADQQAEIRALADLLQQPRRLLNRLQLVYEAFTLSGNAFLTGVAGGLCGCTAALVECDGGVVVHGRTLDWSWLEGLEELLIDLEVRREGRLLYQCTSIVGFVGVLTGMRVNSGFSLSLNHRNTYRGRWVGEEPDLDVPPLGANPIVAAALHHAMLGGWAVASLLRTVLESAADYDAALVALGASRLIAPCYIALAGCGPGQGAVLTCATGEEVRRIDALATGVGVLCVANLDPSDAETPRFPPAAAPLAHPSPPARATPPAHPVLGRVAAKDFVQGESLLRRDVALKALRAAAAVTPFTAATTGLQALEHTLALPPVDNEATLHVTVMCPALEIYASRTSAGPARLAAKGYRADTALCSTCVLCKSRVACHPAGEAAEYLGPGSLLRRRGGGYYCTRHLPLEVGELSYREPQRQHKPRREGTDRSASRQPKKQRTRR